MTIVVVSIAAMNGIYGAMSEAYGDMTEMIGGDEGKGAIMIGAMMASLGW